jgi:uncharacterized membrane protein
LFRDLSINWIKIFHTRCKQSQRFSKLFDVIFETIPIILTLFNRIKLLWFRGYVAVFTFLRCCFFEHSGFSSFLHLNSLLQVFCELANSILFKIGSLLLFILQFIFNIWVLLSRKHFAILDWFLNKFLDFMLFYSRTS